MGLPEMLTVAQNSSDVTSGKREAFAQLAENGLLYSTNRLLDRASRLSYESSSARKADNALILWHGWVWRSQASKKHLHEMDLIPERFGAQEAYTKSGCSKVGALRSTLSPDTNRR